MNTKLLLILTTMMFCFFSLVAQDSNHMAFMGIPITGNVDTFSRKLNAKGFVNLPNNEGLRMLTGKFANQDVTLCLLTLDGTQEVFRVGVAFEPRSSWDHLESHQNTLVELYTKKYGIPKHSIRHIESGYRDSGNYMFFGFHNGSVKYADLWNLEHGTIQIFISSYSVQTASIIIIYEDHLNTELLEAGIMSQI